MTPFHHQIVECFLFGLGASIGSFLNVCVYRLPARLSLAHPCPCCPRCETPIALRDNVPVLGWLLLGGRCRACRLLISPRYPTVELCTGWLFAGAYWFQIARPRIDPLEGALLSHVSGVALLQLVGCVLITSGLMGWDAVARRRRPTLAVCAPHDHRAV